MPTGGEAQTLRQQRRHPGLDLSSAVLDLEQKLVDLRNRESADQVKLAFLFGPPVHPLALFSIPSLGCQPSNGAAGAA